jgi:hypothetical protein
VENTCMTTSFHKEGGLGIEISLIHPIYIEVPVRSQESERSCTCVQVVLILPLFLMFIRFDFGTVLTPWYFFIFHFTTNKKCCQINIEYL